MNRVAAVTVVFIAVVTLSGCGNDDVAKPGDVDHMQAAGKGSAAPTIEQMRMWSDSCALCHVTGVAGAPRVAHADDWSVRNEKGAAVLLQHTLEGFNKMPPLGYCMACEEEDFVALIEFMGSP